MDRRLEAAIAAARAAGEVALKYFRTELTVERKSDASPVTRADREAEERAVAVLRAALPDCGVLGEEYGEQGSQDRRWIVDPIDGTRSFIRGIPYFATLIALEEEGEITTGVIYAPALGRSALRAERAGRVRSQRTRCASRASRRCAGRCSSSAASAACAAAATGRRTSGSSTPPAATRLRRLLRLHLHRARPGGGDDRHRPQALGSSRRSRSSSRRRAAASPTSPASPPPSEGARSPRTDSFTRRFAS
jgi:fructose-1,6-bisphosphatase/inositol monophosphatase family enzyme